MKKFTIILILISTSYVTYAQLHIGINSDVLYPLGQSRNEIDFGFGAGMAVGYLINNNIDIIFGIDQKKYNSLIPNFKVRSEYLSINYLFNDKNLRPYISGKVGIFHKSYEVAFDTEKETALGIAPQLGVMYYLGKSKKLTLDVSANYSATFFKNKLNSTGLEVALIYFFR